MTESEFLALKPRERDAVVAKRVMGFCPHDSSMVEPDTFRGEVSYYWCCWCFDRRPSRHAFDQPRYTTDISAAWQVVEKMREDPEPRLRTLRLVAYSYNRTYATFDSSAEGDDWTEANGEHATPLAICLAALKAKGAIE